MLLSKMRTYMSRRLIAVLAVLGIGCTSGEDRITAFAALPNDDVVFITQNVEPNVVMDALFTGRVLVDDAGCLRLDAPPPDASTVVWPKGFTLDGSHIRDASGRSIGHIGGSFRFGGGHVPDLDHVEVDARMRESAKARCPGSYWIVGSTP